MPGRPEPVTTITHIGTYSARNVPHDSMSARRRSNRSDRKYAPFHSPDRMR